MQDLSELIQLTNEYVLLMANKISHFTFLYFKKFITRAGYLTIKWYFLINLQGTYDMFYTSSEYSPVNLKDDIDNMNILKRMIHPQSF